MTGFPACRWVSPTRQQPRGGEKLVFDQGAIGQQELAKALAEDFDGLTHEQLRQRLINGAPKYGNDDDSVDQLLARAYQTYIDELKQYHNPRYGRGPIGGNYYAGTSSISANVPFGAQTMATPDGRKAHTPLAEGPARPPVPIIWGRRRLSVRWASCRPGRSSAACCLIRS